MGLAQSQSGLYGEEKNFCPCLKLKPNFSAVQPVASHHVLYLNPNASMVWCTSVKLCSQVGNISASYSGPGFKNRPGDKLTWQVLYIVLLAQFSRQMPKQNLKLSHNLFLPHPFQSIIHQSSYLSPHYNFSYRQHHYIKHRIKLYLYLIKHHAMKTYGEWRHNSMHS
jgi:hypothetical protein